MSIDEEYFKSKEFKDLLESYETAMEQGNAPFMDADDLVDIADYYSWQEEPEMADKAIEHALELFPASTLPNVYKARNALTQGNFEEARQFATAIESHDDPDYHYLIAEILIAEGKTDEADQYLRNYGKSVDPDEYQDFIKDCANLYIDYDVSDKAYEWMMRSKGDDSDDFKELMARTLLALGKYKDAIRLLNELVESNPYSGEYWNALASAQFLNEEFSEAVTSSEYAIAINPEDPNAISSKANALMRLNNYEEALKYYERFSELVPNDEFGWLHQGFCLAYSEQTEKAIEMLNKALEVCPADSPFLVQIYQELAFCYGTLKNPEKAMQMLDKTEDLECDHIDMSVVRGHILLQNGLVKQAEEAFKNAIMHSESSPEVLLRIIVSLYDNHYLNACYTMLVKFLGMIKDYYPDFRGGYAYMALCCYDLKKVDDFMKYLRLAVKYNQKEAKEVLSPLFPQGTPVSEYVKYMEQRIEN